MNQEKEKLTENDLVKGLTEQLYLIDTSITNFSNHQELQDFKNKKIGNNSFKHKVNTEIEAKRIATIVRVLVHDTQTSRSLLKSLNYKEKIEYLNTAPPNDGRLHSMTGMSGVRGNNSEPYFGLLAKINKNGEYIVSPQYMQHLPEWYINYKSESFDKWWSGMQIYSHKGIKYSRKDFILYLANKDGGAHVDIEHPSGFIKLKKDGLKMNVSEVSVKFNKDVIYATVAQIGWELLNSINIGNTYNTK